MAQLNDERRARYRHELETSETPLRGQNKMVFYKLAPGTTRVRILPGIDPSSPDKDFFCKAGTHYWANASNPKLPIPCAKIKNPKSTCVVCDKVAELKASSNRADNLESEKLRVRVRYYMGLIPREGEAAGKVHVYPAPKAIYTKVLSLMEDPEYGDITHPTEGFDIKITRTGTGMETKYDGHAVRNPSPISEDPKEIEEVLAAQPELWRFRESPTQDEIEKFINGDLDRFTTGGFAIKTVDLPVDPFESTSIKMALVNSSPGMGLDPDLVEPVRDDEETEVIPTPVVKKKKFSNLENVREMLSK